MKLYMLGTSPGSSQKGRTCSAILLETNGSYYLFDCGANVEEKMTDMDMTIEKMRAAFITHMHIDHAGAFFSIIKRFYHYNFLKTNLVAYLPEQIGIDSFKAMTEIFHIRTTIERVGYRLIEEGEIYSDENVTVRAISTKHIECGAFPTYAFDVTVEGKRFIYTGDLWKTFEDYPKVISEEEFDLVICEYAHIDLEKNMDILKASRTKKMIFTHYSDLRVPPVETLQQELPYEICVAKDGMCFLM